MAKQSIFSTVVEVIKDIFRFWNKPKEGKYISYKEFAAFAVGGMGVYGAIITAGFLTLSAGLYVAAALDVKVFEITFIGIVSSIFTILRAPLITKVVDNTNSKYGKFRPYLIWMPLPIIVSALALVFVTPMFQGNHIVMLVVFTLLFNVMQLFLSFYNLAFTTLVQVISPLQSERELLMGVGSTIYSLGSTFTTMIFPIVANVLFTVRNGEDVTMGINTMKAFYWIFPILLLLLFALGYWTAFGTKERTITSKKYVQKVSLRAGFSACAKNKYFWLSNLSSVLSFAKLYTTGLTAWICTYMLQSDWAQGIMVLVLGGAWLPGMLGAPYLIKKFGKKNLVVLSNIFIGVCALPMFFFANTNGWVLLGFIFFITLASSVQIVTGPAVGAQVFDYQQYKTGDRMEGAITQCGSVIATALGIGFAFILPAIYAMYGYIDKAEVLNNSAVLVPIIKTLAAFAFFSG
ncbi:MAG: MFS transporter, partial [Clostridiales bacterium]|nr:MFS transporter [Clostridiales bacterium]